MSKLQITKATILAYARWQTTKYNLNSAAKKTLDYCQKKQIQMIRAKNDTISFFNCEQEEAV